MRLRRRALPLVAQADDADSAAASAASAAPAVSLRITGGLARGRIVRTPVPDGVRPTSERVREALFSMLGQDLAGQRVLDAFGGAGMVGLECWSRGAAVTVIERDRAALRAIRLRGEEVGAAWSLLAGEALRRAPELGPFDGVFVDPPYAMDPVAALGVLGPLARRWLVVEARSDRELGPIPGAPPFDRRRDYGRTSLWLYRG